MGHIISASRRCDIPAQHADWFRRRLEQEFCHVRTPKGLRAVSLRREDVDGIVLWTKNPAPLYEDMSALRGYPFYFQFTLNAYGPDIEPAVPSKGNVLIPLFRRMAGELGSDRMVWRYDPVFISPRYGMEHHLGYFEKFARLLSGCTDTCVTSFIDLYGHVSKKVETLGIREPSRDERLELISAFADIARQNGMRLQTCAEPEDYARFGVTPSRCVDPKRLSRIAGRDISALKDPSQRKLCGCAVSIDIGSYDIGCGHNCAYCYANTKKGDISMHADPDLPYMALRA